jgi:CRP/FNR family nitrogen fixation transcriptional regulator
MNTNRAGLNIDEPVWTHERVASSRPIPQALESLAIVSRYQRDEEIYPQQGGVECWYRVVSGAARRFSVCAEGRRQIVDLLLPGDFFGFGVRGTHAFAAEAIVADTVIARYPASRIETLATSNPRGAQDLPGIVLDAISRLHSLLLILGRTTAEQKVGSFLLHMQERVGDGGADRLTLPVSRYDIADFLALSVETVSRSLTGLKERGVITLSGPREIGIIDHDALAEPEERDASEEPGCRQTWCEHRPCHGRRRGAHPWKSGSPVSPSALSLARCGGGSIASNVTRAASPVPERGRGR